MTKPIRCFYLERTDQVELTLRRYQRYDPRRSSCSSSGLGYHNAEAVLEQLSIAEFAARGWPMTSEGQPCYTIDTIPRTDARWPARCSCGYEFERQDRWQCNPTPLYRRSDTGELLTLDKAPAGAMWDATWFHDRAEWIGPDGVALTVKLPDGWHWHVDGPAYEKGKVARDRVWTRTGALPDVTATPSILTPRYQGFLRPAGSRPAKGGPQTVTKDGTSAAAKKRNRNGVASPQGASRKDAGTNTRKKYRTLQSVPAWLKTPGIEITDAVKKEFKDILGVDDSNFLKAWSDMLDAIQSYYVAVVDNMATPALVIKAFRKISSDVQEIADGLPSFMIARVQFLAFVKIVDGHIADLTPRKGENRKKQRLEFAVTLLRGIYAKHAKKFTDDGMSKFVGFALTLGKIPHPNPNDPQAPGRWRALVGSHKEGSVTSEILSYLLGDKRRRF